jgi:hypothetical protein
MIAEIDQLLITGLRVVFLLFLKIIGIVILAFVSVLVSIGMEG